MVTKQPQVDFENLSAEELDQWHERIMKAKESKAIEVQNELIAEYADLREKMIKAGVASEDQLPRFKRRGWTRSKPN